LKYKTGGGHLIKDISLKSCIEFAVATEAVGAKFYAQLAKKFAGTAELAGLFEQLGKDEEVHQRQFSDLLGQLPAEKSAAVSADNSDYIRAMSASEFFSREQGPFANIEKIQNRDDALEKVFGFEKATLGFYNAVKDTLGENATLQQIIDAEKRHVTRIMKVMIAEAKFRSLEDEWP
jgi:rubrerythrin